ncbi:hypothetical protein [Chitinivorax sp. B]|uniref:hypothetical protein n=1 Tax=Chitinivorax sp. B TaxID=2502235 RepID=UPI0010F6FB39|nr:hypothetical protein [Chitinivorax sp. B]
MKKTVLTVTGISLCLGLTACGGGGGSESTPSPTPTPPVTGVTPAPAPGPAPAPVPSPTPTTPVPPSVPLPPTTTSTTPDKPVFTLPSNPTVDRLLAGDVYSLYVDEESQALSVLTSKVLSDGILLDDRPGKGGIKTPTFLHQLLTASPKLQIQTAILDPSMNTARLGNAFQVTDTPGWLTHGTSPTRVTYRFKLETIDLVDQLMKDNLKTSLGEDKDGRLSQSGTTLRSQLGEAKFPAGAVGLRTHLALPAKTVISSSGIAMYYPTMAKFCIKIGKDMLLFKLGTANTVSVYSAKFVGGHEKCTPTGDALGEGRYQVMQDETIGSYVQQHYLFDFPHSFRVEALSHNQTYLKHGSKLAISVKDNVTGYLGAYFDKDTELIDPQLHFNKTAIDALKVQLGM